MRKLKILLATLAMTLLMATPVFAADINITIGGTICTNCTINSNNDTTEEDNSTNLDDSAIVGGF